MIWYNNRRSFGGDLAGWRYKEVHNSLGIVPNAPLASAPGKDPSPTPPTCSMLEIHEGQVKREIYVTQ